MVQILFSDIDGSIVHYHNALREWGNLSDHPDDNGLWSYKDKVWAG